MTLPRTRTGRPRLTCTHDVLRYWVERIGMVAPENESFQRSSMICESDCLFHYGHHFELARIMRDKRGRTRLVLLNGDSWNGANGFGASTSSRQGETRRAVEQTGVPSMVVPFSALDAAGIDIETVRPIDVRADRHTIEEHSSRKRPADLTTMPDPSGAMRTEKYWGYNSDWKHGEHEREVPVYVPNPERTKPFFSGHGWCDNGAELRDDGVWHWHVNRHWLGDSIFRARTVENRTRKPTADELAHHEAHEKWTTEHHRLCNEERKLRHKAWKLDDRHRYQGDYRRMTRCMFAAQGFHEAAERVERLAYEIKPVYSNGLRNGRMPITVTRWATFLSSFDYQERQPLYFLCELPYNARPNTVEEALEALKPPEVVAALARGLKVIRQGDLFAIPTKLDKRQIRRMAGGREFEKHLRVLGTNHSVTEGIVLKGGAVLGRGIMRHEPEAWRPPDHARQKLGANWHLLVRNTVPRTR